MGNATSYTKKENQDRQMNGLRYDLPTNEHYKGLDSKAPYYKPTNPIQSIEDLQHATFRSMGVTDYKLADSIGLSKTIVVVGDTLKNNIIRFYTLQGDNPSFVVLLKKINGYYYYLNREHPKVGTLDINSCDACVVSVVDDGLELAVKKLVQPLPQIANYSPVIPYMSFKNFKARKFTSDGYLVIIQSNNLMKSAHTRGLVMMKIDTSDKVYILRIVNDIVYEKNTSVIDFESAVESVVFSFGTYSAYHEFTKKYENDLIDYHARQTKPKKSAVGEQITGPKQPVVGEAITEQPGTETTSTASTRTEEDPEPSAPPRHQIEGC